MENFYINHAAVWVSAVLSLVIGGLWYSPIMFFKQWQKETGLTDEDLKKSKPAVTYSLTLVLAAVMAYSLAFYLGDAKTNWQWGLTAGFLAGFGWAALMFGVICLFEQRSFKYFLINGLYMTVWFTISGLIIGAWR